jgi:hypothetical protein
VRYSRGIPPSPLAAFPPRPNEASFDDVTMIAVNAVPPASAFAMPADDSGFAEAVDAAASYPSRYGPQARTNPYRSAISSGLAKTRGTRMPANWSHGTM